MMDGIRIGRIFGLEVRVDYSWFLIFFLILWLLTGAVFPAAYPGRPVLTYIAMGIAGTLLFFTSLLAHEISHSIVARRRGIPVEGITLFIFGGISRTRMDAQKPRDEFIIAAMGPVASLAVAMLFGAIAWLSFRISASSPIAVVAQYLAAINVALALFNLLPGFPLDGGRLLRAVIWKKTGDLDKATRIATTGGKWIGYALMGIGLFEMFVLRSLGGLWLVFIGWFVRIAAEASFAQHLLLRSLQGIRVRDVMTPQPDTVSADVSVQEFVDEYILRARFQAYPVVENAHKPVGVIGLEQVKKVPREQWAALSVRDVMAPLERVAIAAPHENMSEVLPRLAGSASGRVLVMRNGNIEGLITRGDLSRLLERAQLMARK